MIPRTIVVPLDGSMFAERALPVASALAERLGSQGRWEPGRAPWPTRGRARSGWLSRRRPRRRRYSARRPRGAAGRGARRRGWRPVGRVSRRREGAGDASRPVALGRDDRHVGPPRRRLRRRPPCARPGSGGSQRCRNELARSEPSRTSGETRRVADRVRARVRARVRGGGRLRAVAAKRLRHATSARVDAPVAGRLPDHRVGS